MLHEIGLRLRALASMLPYVLTSLILAVRSRSGGYSISQKDPAVTTGVTPNPQPLRQILAYPTFPAENEDRGAGIKSRCPPPTSTLTAGCKNPKNFL